MENLENSKAELQRYIKQTNEIHELSSLQISKITSANSYRALLLENYTRIGELSDDNAKILREHFYPLVEFDRELSHEDIELLRFFANELIDSQGLHNMDVPIVFHQAGKLLGEANRLDDDEVTIMAMDGMVTAAYLMLVMTERQLPVNDICFEYKRVGLRAGERLLEYLDPQKFSKLSDELKELVVINSRYIRVVSGIDEEPGDPEESKLLLKRMLDSLALADDPFYREQLPNYDWTMHRFRVYEYISTLTDINNVKGYGPEELKIINECTKALKELYESDKIEIADKNSTRDLDIFLARNSYLAGESDLESYKATLVSLMMQDFRDKETGEVPMIMLQAPLEYMLVIDPKNATMEEQSYLNLFYNRLIGYMHKTPKKDMFTFLLSCLVLIFKNFVEVQGGMDLETLGLSIMAALHPPTYVHSLSVADLSKFMTGHLLSKKPELFVGMLGYGSVEEVKEHTAEIENYVYHASLCHDLGKLVIAETIMTYGRTLLEDEFQILYVHPEIGAYFLERYPSTNQYVDVARGHHKWYDDKAGYPRDFIMSDSPFRTAIDIVTCADCMDAATDSVGRSYKIGKTFDEFIDELREGSGTRYSPHLVELMDDDEIREEIRHRLDKVRDENYKKAFFTLKKYEMTQ